MTNVASGALKIVIAGYIAGGPLGGLVWHHFQYALGLKNMGHDVIFIEDSDDYPSCYNPNTHELSDDPSYGIGFIEKIFTRFEINDKWAYYHALSKTWFGLTEKKVKKFCGSADLFLNLSGVNPVREFVQKIPVRVFIDTDPVFTQIRHLTEPAAFARAKLHNRFFTFGENFGSQNCGIPDDGFNWQPTRQPVFLKAWNYSTGNKNAKWTTVMQWDSYKSREYNSQVFGMKSASFDDYFSLPKKISDSFELAIGSATAPKEKLLEAGWNISDPLAVTLSPSTYQQYIQQSKGEWSIAKHGYVGTNSGWFSERSTGYLASGRPVVVQETGFSEFIETGRGLFSFTSPAEAVVAIEEVNHDYAAQCNWAREIAEEYFRFDKVLNALLLYCQTPVAIK
jgi:hypothetical protein